MIWVVIVASKEISRINTQLDIHGYNTREV